VCALVNTNAITIVGFPSEHEELLEEYKESTCAEQVESVFPYVPIEVVINIIQNHGGIK